MRANVCCVGHSGQASQATSVRGAAATFIAARTWWLRAGLIADRIAAVVAVSVCAIWNAFYDCINCNKQGGRPKLRGSMATRDRLQHGCYSTVRLHLHNMLSCARHGATSEDMLECVTHTCSVCVVSSFVRYERAGFTMAAHLPQFYCIQGERFDAYLYVKYLWPPAGATENGPENEHKGEQTEPQRSGLGLRDWI